MQQLQFSLFPFYLISKPEESLVIGKSGEVSPNFDDLEGSPFMKNTKQRLTQRTLFYNFGTTLSPYLKTMRELRLLHCVSGNLDELHTAIKESRFKLASEDDNTVLIDDAEMQILRKTAAQVNLQTVITDAPDHLMRLFAYNHILMQYAKTWNTDALFTNEMVREAAAAYVVSPVSSLVVLETEADYKRFDITDTENSLKNATKNLQKGNNAPIGDGVWFLLLLSVLFMLRKRILITKKQ
jgi:XrtN system VIT domain protein